MFIGYVFFNRASLHEGVNPFWVHFPLKTHLIVLHISFLI